MIAVLCGGPVVSVIAVLCGGPVVSVIAVFFGGPMVVYGLICGNRGSESLPTSCRKLKVTGDNFEYVNR